MRIHCPHCLKELSVVELDLPEPEEDGSTRMRDVVRRMALKNKVCPHCGYQGSGIILEEAYLELQDQYKREMGHAARRIANRDRQIKELKAELESLRE